MDLKHIIFAISGTTLIIYIIQEYFISKLIFIRRKKKTKKKLIMLIYPIAAFLYYTYQTNIVLGNVFHTIRFLIFIISYFYLLNVTFSELKPFFSQKFLYILLGIVVILYILETIIIFKLFNKVSPYNIFLSQIIFYLAIALLLLKSYFFLYSIRKSDKYKSIYMLAISVLLISLIINFFSYIKLIRFYYTLDISLIISIWILIISNQIEYLLAEKRIYEYISNFVNNKSGENEYNDKIPLGNLLEIYQKNNKQIKYDIGLRKVKTKVNKYVENLENIIKRKTNELSIHKDKYKQFYDNAPFIYLSFDLKGNLIKINNLGLKLLKYKKNKIIAQNIFSLIKESKEKHIFKNLLDKNITIEEFKEFELTLLTKDRSEIVVNTFVEKDLGNNYACIMEEITHQKKLHTRNEIIFNINKLISNNKEIDQLIKYYAKEINKELNFDELLIRLLSGNPEQLYKLNKLEFDNKIAYVLKIDSIETLKKDLILETLKEKDYIIFNPENYDNFSSIILSKNSKSGIIIPLKYSKDIKAILEISTYTVKDWNLEDIDIVLKTAPILSVVFEFTHLLKQIVYSESRYKNIVETSYDAIIILDELGNIIELNNSAYLLLEWDNEKHGSIIGKNINIFLKEEIHFSLIRRNLENSFRELKLITKKGKEFTIDINLTKSSLENETKIYCVINDITEKYNKELQLIQTSKMATLGEMATSIAHELNQPLNNIGIIAQRFLLKIEKKEIDPNFFISRLELLLEQIKRASKIINHMREFGKKSGQYEDKVIVNDAIKNIFALISEQLKVRNINFELILKNKIPPILANKNNLEQILLNLVSNARDSMEETKIKKLIVKTYYNLNKVYIDIIDTGIGIKEKIKEKIFEPFFTTKEVGKGTGLGLSISYKLAKDYNGDIIFRSRVNKGTTFTIIFPIYRNGNINDEQ